MMKCPNCGAEMPVGSLYCEQCGEDIHIVPDFEPEVELNIEEIISGIAEDIQEERNENDRDEEMRDKDRRKGIGFRLWTSLVVLLGVLCLAAVTGGIFAYQYNSFQIQVDRAVRCVTEEQYDKAIRYYIRALEIDDSDIDVMFELAEVYLLKNNKIEYEYLMREIIKRDNATNEQVETAYGKLIAILRAREDYKSINELLLASGNENLIYTYQNYVAMAPEFSIMEGYYTDLQPLKLTAYGTGKIYYTMDGSIPDENSEQYIAPIILDDGDYTVRAFFVNEYGIASESVSKTYHIEIEALSPPDVRTVSGEYYFPADIELDGDLTEIYYTTDGSEPTLSSTPYTGPVHMPLGETKFRFMRIDGVRSSEIVERTYSLTMNTEYTPQEAETDVVAYLLQSGKIYDEAGHFDDSEAAYIYQYQYVTNINGVDDFYVISEIYRDEEGALSKTGSHFAVNAYTGEIHKLQINGNNNYTIVEIEEQPEDWG